MPHRIRSKNNEIPITGGVGYGPDTPIDQAASAGDEEPAFAQTTPDAPPIAPPGDEKAFEQFRQECLHGRKDRTYPDSQTAAQVVNDRPMRPGPAPWSAT